MKKPWVFGHGGVDKEPIATGLVWTAPTTEVVRINVQPMQFEMQFNDFMSKDAVPLDFHAVIRLQVTDAVKLVERFGPDWYKNNIGRELENRVRTAVKKHGMNETAIETTAIDQIDAEVSMAMEKYIKDVDLPVKMIHVSDDGETWARLCKQHDKELTDSQADPINVPLMLRCWVRAGGGHKIMAARLTGCTR